MKELIQWFVQTASISGEHTAGMVIAGMIVFCISSYTAYQFLSLILDWFKSIKPFQINKIQKIDKIVEVPKYVDNSYEIKEILLRVKDLEKEITSLKKDGVNL